MAVLLPINQQVRARGGGDKLDGAGLGLFNGYTMLVPHGPTQTARSATSDKDC